MGAMNVAGNTVAGVAGGAMNQMALNYKRDVALQNASISDAAARDAVNRGTQAAAREQEKGAQVEGAAKSAYGASGVTLEGSPMQVLADTNYYTNMGVQTAMNNAAREAWGYKVRATQQKDQAGMWNLESGMNVLDSGMKLWSGASSGAAAGGLLGGGGDNGAGAAGAAGGG